LYETEVVSESEARKFADEINAYFKYTSALINSGIEDLFKELGANYLKCKNNLSKKNNYDCINDNSSTRISIMEQQPKKSKKCCGGNK